MLFYLHFGNTSLPNNSMHFSVSGWLGPVGCRSIRIMYWQSIACLYRLISATTSFGLPQISRLGATRANVHSASDFTSFTHGSHYALKRPEEKKPRRR